MRESRVFKRNELRKMFKAAKPIKTGINFLLGEAPAYRDPHFLQEPYGLRTSGLASRAWAVRVSAFCGVNEAQGKKVPESTYHTSASVTHSQYLVTVSSLESCFSH